MNKAQKEVLQSQLDEEKKVIKLLERVYEQAKKDCEQKIKELSARTDLENLQSIIYQKEYQQLLVDQLESILYDLHEGQFTTIADYLQEAYVNGYTSVYYDLSKTSGIPLVIPIRQDLVVKAVQTDSKLSSDLYTRLGEDVNYLKRSVRAELSRGIASGSSWNEIAVLIANGMNSPFKKSINNAIRIARTEGHRIQNEGALDGQHEAKKKGANIVKQWSAALDGRTRPEHQEADGQIREIDEPFDVGGEKMQAPGVGGSARNVCNCRCRLLQRAKWALDEDELDTLKERAAFFGLDKTKDFEDFKKKYCQLPDNADTINVNSDVCKELQKIRDRLNGKRASTSDLIEAGKIVKNHIGNYQMSNDEKEYNDAYSKVMEMSKLIRSGKMSINDEYREVYKRWKDAEQKVQNLEETHAKWLSESLSEIRQMGTKGIESDVLAHLGNSRSTVRKYVESAYSYYPREWVEKSMQRGGLSPKKVKRGYYSDFNKEIAISGEGGRAFQTSVHELGHRFERAVPEIRDAEEEFYKHRTNGESLKWLGQGYRRDEKTRFDDFIDPYMGKDYGGSAYELVSMGFELAFTHPDRLTKDPEMESWILGILSLY